MRLCVVTHKHIYKHEENYYSFAGFPRQIAALQQIFDEVVVCSTVRNDTMPNGSENLTAQGLAIAPLPYVPTDSILGKVLFMLSAPLFIWKIWRAVTRADVVQIRMPHYVGILGALVMRFVGLPTFVWMGGDWSGVILSRGNSLSRRIAARFLRWSLPRLLQGWLIFVPEPRIFGSGISRVEAVQVVNASLWKHELPNYARESFPLIANKFSLLFVGRLETVKGVDILLRALAATSKDCWHLNIVGDGIQLQELQALTQRLDIAEQVTFHGWIARNQLDSFYRNADVVILPSRNEMSPKVALEAMSYGAVVVGSEVGALTSLLAEGRGILFRTGDEKQLASVIQLLFEQPGRYLKMCQAARSFAEENTFEALNAIMISALGEKLGLSKLD